MAVNKAFLAKEVDGVMHYIYPKTSADMVDYTDTKTVKQKLDEIEANVANTNSTANDALSRAKAVANEVDTARTPTFDPNVKDSLAERLTTDFEYVRKTFDDHVKESHHDMITNITREGLIFTAYNAANEELFKFNQQDTTYTAGTALELKGQVFSHSASPVKAGTYGTSTTAPVVTVDAQGHVTEAKEVTIEDVKPASHVHGNITNEGVISGEAAIPADGDTILVGDASDGNAIKKSSVAFGNSDVTFLRNDGTWSGPVKAGTLIEVNGTTVSHADSTVAPGEYGTSTAAPKVTVDQQGHVTKIENVTIENVKPASHVHGNINNEGALDGEAAPITNGDALIYASGEDGSIKKSTIAFGASKTTFLSNSGEWLNSVEPGDGLSVDGVKISHDKSTAESGTYGSATKLPRVSIDDKGHITSVEEVVIAGVAPSSHNHGNISNEGEILGGGDDLGNGDKLVFVDSDTGLVNQSTITFGTGNTSFLSNAGTWESLEVGDGIVHEGNKFSHQKTDIGAKDAGGVDKFPIISVDDMGHVTSISEREVSKLVGASAEDNGAEGLVPMPMLGDQNKFLRGDATWAVPTDTKYSGGAGINLNGTSFSANFDDNGEANTVSRSDHVHEVATTEAAGFMPILKDNATYFLNGSGEWTVPPDTKYTAGDGLALAGTKFSVSYGGDGEATTVSRSDHTHAYSANTHGHGNITNTGTITADTAKASGQHLVLTDVTTNKVVRSALAIGTATNTYLRNDGTWSTPPDTKYNHPTSTAAGSYGSTTVIPKITVDSLGHITAVADQTVKTMGGASGTADGSVGFVPAPKTGQQNYFLRGDGTWVAINLNVAEMTGAGAETAGKAGTVPAPKAGEQNYFLRGDGKWSAVATTNSYHTSGTWSGLKYTATAVGGAGVLEFTIPTGTTATTVALGNHSHGVASGTANGFMSSTDKTHLDSLYKGRIWAEDLDA